MSYSWDDDSGSSSNSYNDNSGFNYTSARNAYKSSGSSSNSSLPSSSNQSRTINSAISGRAPVGKIIQTDSENVTLVRIDITGSNEKNAKIFFKKLPLLYQDSLRYLPNNQISFGAIGDAYSDQCPLQVEDFGEGPILDEKLSHLYIEKNCGGGQGKETYELAAYFDVKCCEIPKAVNPFYFLLCDEGFYDFVNKNHVSEYIGIDMSESVSAEQVFKELMQKFNVFILRCKYTSGNGNEDEIHRSWVNVFGEDRVIILEDAETHRPTPERAVDVMLAIIAKQTGHFDDFSQRLNSRQTPNQVKSVMKSIRSVAINNPGSGKSTQANGAGNNSGKSSMKMKSKRLV